MQVLFRVSDELNKEKIDITQTENQELLIGQILLNRVAGIAYDNIDLDNAPLEAQKVLKVQMENNIFRNKRFLENLEILSNTFEAVDFKYAFLKGSFLIPFLYPQGHRTSNDIDILVKGDDISKIQNVLLDQGFIQGNLSSSGEIVKATRKEVIEAKMNFGETVPFVKLFKGSSVMIDLNFSVDYKPEDGSIVPEMLESTIYVQKDNIRFNTLNYEDFLIHLCCHLYKEATTHDWVHHRRDLMLYKFSDINVFLHKYGNTSYFTSLVNRIERFRVQKECYYTFENSSVIYPAMNDIDGFVNMKQTIKPSDLRFMTQVVFPRERKLLEHYMSFSDWFFCPNRMVHLKEVPYATN